MRSLLLLLPVLVASCGPAISQREVLGRAKAEVALREPWADSALVIVKEKPAFAWSLWRIEAGRLDDSSFPIYEGLEMLPGTQRELIFARNGCLVRYERQVGGCSNRYQMPARGASAGK